MGPLKGIRHVLLLKIIPNKKVLTTYENFSPFRIAQNGYHDGFSQ